MFIYFYNLLSLPIYSVAIKRKKTFCIIVSIQLFIILALRDVSLGVDLPTYGAGFEYIRTLTFSEMLSRCRFFQTAELVYPFSFESGYVVLNWIVAKLGLNFHGLLIVCAMINTISFGMFVFRYSDKPLLSYSILIAFNFYSYCFGILRQSLATCILLWAVPLILKKKKIKAFLVICLAFLFHRASMVFVLLIALNDIRISKKIIGYFIMGCILLLFSARYIYEGVISIILRFLGMGTRVVVNYRYNNLIPLLALFAILIYVFVDFESFKDGALKLSCWGFMVATVIAIIGMCNDTFARAVYICEIFIVILIPNLINRYQNRNTRFIASCLVYVLMLCYMIVDLPDSTIVPYRVYW